MSSGIACAKRALFAGVKCRSTLDRAAAKAAGAPCQPAIVFNMGNAVFARPSCVATSRKS